MRKFIFKPTEVEYPNTRSTGVVEEIKRLDFSTRSQILKGQHIEN